MRRRNRRPPADRPTAPPPPDSRRAADVTPEALGHAQWWQHWPDENQAPRPAPDPHRRGRRPPDRASGQSPATPPDGPQGPDSLTRMPRRHPRRRFAARRIRRAIASDRPRDGGQAPAQPQDALRAGASDDTAPAAPDLPRKKTRGAPDREEPALGRATGDTRRRRRTRTPRQGSEDAREERQTRRGPRLRPREGRRPTPTRRCAGTPARRGPAARIAAACTGEIEDRGTEGQRRRAPTRSTARRRVPRNPPCATAWKGSGARCRAATPTRRGAAPPSAKSCAG